MISYFEVHIIDKSLLYTCCTYIHILCTTTTAVSILVDRRSQGGLHAFVFSHLSTIFPLRTQRVACSTIVYCCLHASQSTGRMPANAHHTHTRKLSALSQGSSALLSHAAGGCVKIKIARTKWFNNSISARVLHRR